MTLEGLGNIAKNVPKPKLPAGNGPEDPKKDEAPQPCQLASCVIDPPILEPSLWRSSVSADHLALCAAQAGVVWVFELDKGTLLRTYNLDGLTKDDLKKVRLLNFAILGTAFDPSGRLIVAKRNRELTQIAVKLANETTDPVEEKMQKEDFKIFTDLYKDIAWLALDPKTGGRQDLASPADYPTATPSFRKQNRFQFLISPLGQVKTTAFRDWDSLKREFGISFDVPKKDDQESIKKETSEQKSIQPATVVKETKVHEK